MQICAHGPERNALGVSDESDEKDGGLSVLDIKPKYKSNEEYLAQLESEINKMLKTSGKTEAQVYEYIEGSNVYNEEIEQIYSRLHTFNSFKHFHKA